MAAGAAGASALARTVYYYFRAWQIIGTWERLNMALRERVRQGWN